MSNYAQFKKTGNTWYSTPFYSRRSECRFRLCIQPIQNPTSGRSLQNQQVHSGRLVQTFDQVDVAVELLSNPMQPMSIVYPLTVELLNQASDARHCNILSSRSSSGRCAENIVMSRAFGLSVPSTNPRDQVQYLQNDCLFFRVSENEGVRKPWLVDPMPRKWAQWFNYTS